MRRAGNDQSTNIERDGEKKSLMLVSRSEGYFGIEAIENSTCAGRPLQNQGAEPTTYVRC